MRKKNEKHTSPAHTILFTVYVKHKYKKITISKSTITTTNTLPEVEFL